MTRYDAWRCGDIGADASDPRSPAYDPTPAERREKEITDMLADPAWRGRYTAAADQNADGMMDEAWYEQVQRKLADLSSVPADKLIGSDALASVLRLAEQAQAERKSRLRELAEGQVQRRAAA